MIEGGQNAMRLAYSGIHPEEIREGIERLAGLING
jgi:DNA-binding transcriptional MocR family regulator